MALNRRVDSRVNRSKGVINSMLKNIVFRDLRPADDGWTEDVERMVEIAVAAWAPVFASFRELIGEDIYAIESPNPEESKAQQIRRVCDPENPTIVRVVEGGGQVVGFVTFRADPETQMAVIGNNAIHPDFQSMGIGTQMYEHAFEYMRSLGVRYVKVFTGGDPSHAPARRAYEKAGFDRKVPHVEYYREL